MAASKAANGTFQPIGNRDRIVADFLFLELAVGP